MGTLKFELRTLMKDKRFLVFQTLQSTLIIEPSKTRADFLSFHAFPHALTLNTQCIVLSPKS